MHWMGGINAQNELSQWLGLNATDQIFKCIESKVVYYSYGKTHIDSMNSLKLASN